MDEKLRAALRDDDAFEKVIEKNSNANIDELVEILAAIIDPNVGSNAKDWVVTYLFVTDNIALEMSQQSISTPTAVDSLNGIIEQYNEKAGVTTYDRHKIARYTLIAWYYEDSEMRELILLRDPKLESLDLYVGSLRTVVKREFLKNSSYPLTVVVNYYPASIMRFIDWDDVVDLFMFNEVFHKYVKNTTRVKAMTQMYTRAIVRKNEGQYGDTPIDVYGDDIQTVSDYLMRLGHIEASKYVPLIVKLSQEYPELGRKLKESFMKRKY